MVSTEFPQWPLQQSSLQTQSAPEAPQAAWRQVPLPVPGSKLQTRPEPAQHSLVQKHIAFSGWQLPLVLPPELVVDAPTVDVALALAPVVPPVTAVAVVAAVVAVVALPVEPVAPTDEERDEAPEDIEEDVSPAVPLPVEVEAVIEVFEPLVVPPLPPPQAMQRLATTAIVATLIGRPSPRFQVAGRVKSKFVPRRELGTYSSGSLEATVGWEDVVLGGACRRSPAVRSACLATLILRVTYTIRPGERRVAIKLPSPCGNGVYLPLVDGPRQIQPLEDGGYGLLNDLLSQDPTQNLLVLALIDDLRAGRARERVEFYTLEREGPLLAVVMISEHGLWVPVTKNPDAAAALGAALRQLPLLTTIGERAAVDALWRGYRGGRGDIPEPRMARAQRLLEITPDDMGPWVTPQLRLALESELAQVVNASAEMQLADLGRDPRKVDPQLHTARCLERIRAGRTHVIFEGDELVFKADIGSRCRFGAHIEGVYTSPHHRGQGIATRALGQICRTTLSALPRLTLHADPRNRAAQALYRKLGFGERAEFRLLIAD